MRRGPLAVLLLSLAAPIAAQTPRWTATRDLRVGEIDDPDYALTWMQGIALGADGSFYSLHYPEKMVRAFGPDGKLRAKFGRSGKGPGEFDNPAGIGWLGDSLYVWDSVDQRFSLFTPDGTFRNAITVRPVNSDPRGRGAWPTGLLGDGAVLGSVTHGDPQANMSALTVRSSYVRMTRKGDVTDTLTSVTSSNLRFSDPVNQPPRWGITTTNPYGTGSLTVVAGDRRSIYVIDRPVAPGAGSATFAVHRISLNGDTTFSRRIPYTPLRVARQQIDSLTESYVKMLSTQSGQRPARLSRGEAEKLVSNVFKTPPFHPPVQNAIVGQDGTLWLQREGVNSATVTWVALDANAQPLGQVDLPRRFQMQNGTRQFVIGVEYDELETPYIVRYRITSAPRR